MYRVKMVTHSGMWLFAAADGHPEDKAMRAATMLHFEAARELAALVVRRGYEKPEIVWRGPPQVVRNVTAPVEWPVE